MALVEPGPTGVKTAAEASASVEHPAADLAERKLGFVFWMAVAWILLLVFLAVFRDLLPLRDPEALGIRTREVRKYEDPSWNAWFGADSQGRDQLARVVQGTRPALIIGVTVTVIAGFLGTAIGVTSGYLRGRVDAFTTVVIDIFLAFPGLVLLIAVRASFGNSMSVFIVLFSITSIPAYARIVRGASFALSEREFVDAAAAMGATKRRVLWKELAPNVAIPALSFAFIGFALVIVGEGALAFIGLSLDEVTWGKLIAEGTGDIRDHAHISLIPATVMFLTILAFNLAGDGVRRLYSPREVATQRRLRVEGIPAENHDGSVLHISDLYTTLHTPTGDVHAVDGVSMSVRAGQALGIVGESGSGKTMILRSIVGAFALSDVTRSGTVEVAGVDMLRAERSDVMRTLGTEIGMISQNPLTALNPVRRIETQIIEPMTVHRGMSKAQARERALDLLRLVGIPAPERRLREYPHQLSGGMRQRVTIAIALGERAQAAAGRRADHGARRDGAGPDPAPPVRSATATGDGDGVGHPRPRCREGVHRFGGDRLRRPGRRVRSHGRDLRQPAAPLHRCVDAVDAGPRPAQPLRTDHDRRDAALVAATAARVSVHRSLPGSTGGLRIAHPVSGRERRPLVPLPLSRRPRSGVGRYSEDVGAQLMAGTGSGHLRDDAVLRVDELVVEFPVRRKQVVHAVSGVSFDLIEGETLGIVGESGCGKTTTGRAVMRLETVTGGSVTLNGADLTSLDGEELRQARRSDADDLPGSGVVAQPEPASRATSSVKASTSGVPNDPTSTVGSPKCSTRSASGTAACSIVDHTSSPADSASASTSPERS